MCECDKGCKRCGEGDGSCGTEKCSSGGKGCPQCRARELKEKIASSVISINVMMELSERVYSHCGDDNLTGQ